MIVLRHAGLVFVLMMFALCSGQQSSQDDQPRGKNGIRVLFYNAENLFHPSTDSLNRDTEFTPAGERHWSWNKYYGKLNRIAKVILASGGWEPPAIVGLCEIENRKVLYDLVLRSPLKKYGYRIIHFESPDPRGIDVALLYRPEKVEFIKSAAIAVTPYHDTSYHSRDILHASLVLMDVDTLDLFVNHWPSRRSGAKSSSAAREKTARTLCRYAASAFRDRPQAKILLMGDFNDESVDSSLAGLVNTFPLSMTALKPQFPNSKVAGTLVFDPGTGPQWYTFDNFLASMTLKDCRKGFQLESFDFKVFAPEWILTRREIGDEWLPMRSFQGYTYQEGFSDHLPIMVDLKRL